MGFSVVPVAVAPVISFSAISALLIVQFLLKAEHSHPHTYEQRFVWQDNVLLNLVIVYLSVQSVMPLAHHFASRVHSLLLDIGLFVDVLSLWCGATFCLLPVHMHMASGDLPVVRTEYFLTFYLLHCFLFGVNVMLLARLVRRVESA